MITRRYLIIFISSCHLEIVLLPVKIFFMNMTVFFFLIHFLLFRFREAEDDCTEALNLDDRYIKAYSRRATARKELGKLKESIEGVLTQTYMLVFSEYLVLDSFWYSFLMTV